MKIKIEIVEDNEEIIIRCNSLTEEIKEIKQAADKIIKQNTKLVLYKDDTEYYINPSQIIFFETENNKVYAHTTNKTYLAKHKLYELEDLLPNHFIRISKSGILNTNKVYSVSKDFISSSLIQFENTHKQIYVSRFYYKNLIKKLRK